MANHYDTSSVTFGWADVSDDTSSAHYTKFKWLLRDSTDTIFAISFHDPLDKLLDELVDEPAGGIKMPTESSYPREDADDAAYKDFINRLRALVEERGCTVSGPPSSLEIASEESGYDVMRLADYGVMVCECSLVRAMQGCIIKSRSMREKCSRYDLAEFTPGW